MDQEEIILLFNYDTQEISTKKSAGVRKPSKSRQNLNPRLIFYLFCFCLITIGLLRLFIAQQNNEGNGMLLTIPPFLPVISNFSNLNFDDPGNATISEVSYPNTCKLPIFDPWDSTVIPFLEKDADKTRNCDRSWRPYTELVNGTWRVVKEKLGMDCKARCHTLPDLTSPFNTSDWFPPGPTECEFLEAVCWENNTEVYGYVHTQIRPKNLQKPKIDIKDHPDVFVFLVDSLSSGMAKRSLPKTIKFMNEQLKAVDFPFMSQVGARSQVNAIPLWFGKQVEAGYQTNGNYIPVDWSEEEYCNKSLDDKPNLWRDFHKAEYTTLYADDWYYQTLTSNPDCKGFQHFYTNHTFFPVTKIVDVDGMGITRKHLWGNTLCREAHLAAMEYWEQFSKAYGDRPKFNWNWFVHTAHNYLTGANRMDQPFLELFERNFEILNNAFVIFMADHGFRFGSREFYSTPIGALEKRNPFFSISAPKKYRDNGILEVLKKNSRMLQTHYDTRATLLDILKYQPSSQFTDRSALQIPNEKGNSFLRHQPSDVPRNCEHLPIPQQYCICESKSKDILEKKELAQRLGNAVIDYVNGRLEKLKLTDYCHKFKIEKVTSLSLLTSTNTSIFTYHITVKSKFPAEFETFITEIFENGSLDFSEITRLDLYGDTAQCSRKVHFSPLCYCKN